MSDSIFNPYALDRRGVRQAFERAAASYDAAAVLQHTVEARLLERLELVRIAPERILDLGTGTGSALPPLRERYPRAELLALDLAPAMLRQARNRCQEGGFVARLKRVMQQPPRFVAADAQRLPVEAGRIDLAFSNLTLQWCEDLDGAFAEVRRVVRPGGLLTFTTFGPDTLTELRHSWAAVDGASHVNAFMDMHDIGDGLVRSGFENPVMDVEHFTVTYETVHDLMRDLKAIGAHNVTAGRVRHMTGRRRLAALAEAYEAYRQADGRLPATYEVVYGHGWRPEGADTVPAGEDGAAFSVDQLRAGLRRRRNG